jgi:hypothetical protein
MTVTLNLTQETESRLKEKAARSGLTLEAYLQRLAEREAFNGDGAPQDVMKPSGLSFEQMTAPLAQAVEAAGLSDDEVAEFLDDAVKQVRTERRARKGPPS